MNTFIEILQVITNNLIKGIFISVLFLIMTSHFFKNLDTKYSFSILRWFIIFGIANNTTLIILRIIKRSFSTSNEIKVFDWIIISIIMLVYCALLFILINRKFGKNKYFLLLVAILLNIGWFIKLYFTFLTPTYIDLLPLKYKSGSNAPYLQLLRLGSITLAKGLLLGIFVILAGNLISKTKHKNHIHDTQ